MECGFAGLVRGLDHRFEPVEALGDPLVRLGAAGGDRDLLEQFEPLEPCDRGPVVRATERRGRVRERRRLDTDAIGEQDEWAVGVGAPSAHGARRDGRHRGELAVWDAEPNQRFGELAGLMLTQLPGLPPSPRAVVKPFGGLPVDALQSQAQVAELKRRQFPLGGLPDLLEPESFGVAGILLG